MNKSRRFIILFALIAGGIWIGRLSTHLDNLMGRSFSQDSSEDVRELKRLSFLATPAIDAIENFMAQNGAYPPSMNTVNMDLPTGYLENTFFDFGGGFPSFHYSLPDEEDTYVLYMKLNLEGALFYQGQGRWTYRQEMNEWEVFPELGIEQKTGENALRPTP